ncbi:B12-binding domain-containing radical SAM protein [Thermodesulfobacteriota bacterium]
MKSLDAIIISDYGIDTFSGTSPFRLHIDEKHLALIQNVKNCISNNGNINEPIADEIGNWQSAAKLNGLMLYSVLTNRGHSVELIDSYNNERDFFEELIKLSPKAIIISTTFILNKTTLVNLVNEVRSKCNAKIIVGGPFVYSSYLLSKKKVDESYDTESPKEDFLFLSKKNLPDVDLYIVSRDGLTILTEVLDCIKVGANLKDIPNTAIWNGSNYIFSKRIEETSKSEILKIDWKAIPRRFFNTGVVNIQASNGCPYKCEFCNFVKDRKFTYIKPLDTLISELKAVSSFGVKYVRFVDDNFRLGKPDLNEVCERFIREGINIKWMSFLRASTIKKTDLNLLKKAGCMEVQIGIESADINVLDNMNKKADPQMYKEVINDLLNHGINCSCCFVVGFPGETIDSYNRTIEFIESIPQETHTGLFYWSIYPFFFVPLSPVYEPSKRGKYELSGYMDKWKHMTMDSTEAQHLVKNAFLNIKRSSPIYSGDNINMLLELPLNKRKEFFLKRHELAKLSITNRLEREQIYNAFSGIVN